jgi:hypothetical protein
VVGGSNTEIEQADCLLWCLVTGDNDDRHFPHFHWALNKVSIQQHSSVNDFNVMVTHELGDADTSMQHDDYPVHQHTTC